MDTQVLTKDVQDKYLLAQKYYQIISGLNNLKLADGEIQLVAFAAIHGNISDNSLREDYIEKYGTTVATINNIVHRLKKKQVFLKEGKKIFVNPAITQLDFDSKINLVVKIDIIKKVEKVNNLNVKKYG